MLAADQEIVDVSEKSSTHAAMMGPYAIWGGRIAAAMLWQPSAVKTLLSCGPLAQVLYREWLEIFEDQWDHLQRRYPQTTETENY